MSATCSASSGRSVSRRGRLGQRRNCQRFVAAGRVEDAAFERVGVLAVLLELRLGEFRLQLLKQVAGRALELRHLVDLAAAQQRVLMVGHTFVYHPAVRVLRIESWRRFRIRRFDGRRSPYGDAEIQGRGLAARLAVSGAKLVYQRRPAVESRQDHIGFGGIEADDHA